MTVDGPILARRTRLRTLLLMGLGLALTGACSSPNRTGGDAEPNGDLVAEGTFEGRENMSTTGTYRLERRDDRLYLALEKDFRTDSGPDLHVVLSATEADSVTGSTAVPDGALIVDTLQSQTGPQRYTKKYDRPVTGVSPAVLAKMKKYHWPGNVRELEHMTERAVIMSDNKTLQPEDFFFADTQTPAPGDGLALEDYDLASVEAQVIRRALDDCEGNISRAAEELGISRAALYRRMEKYGL